MCLSRINGCCPDRGKTGVRRTVWAGVGGEDGAGVGSGAEQHWTRARSEQHPCYEATSQVTGNGGEGPSGG